MTSVLLINSAIISGIYLAIFFISELLYRVVKVNVEISRKFVHISAGLAAFLLPIIIDNHWAVLFLCITLGGLVHLGQRYNFLPSIHAIDRKSQGSFLYPIVVYLLYLTYSIFKEPLLFYVPMSVLAFSDPIAALVGKKYDKLRYYLTATQFKTIPGSLAFLIIALITCPVIFSIFTAYDTYTIIKLSLAISLTSTFIEAITPYGFDNLTIPLVVVTIMLFFFNI